MALNKVNYINNETIITAANLNQIQDEIINNSMSAKLWNMQIIPDGSNLNNFQTIGSYCMPQSAGAITLENCPIDEAFIMYVVNGTGIAESGPLPSNSYGYYSQYIIPFNANGIYRRNLHYNGEAGFYIGLWYDISYKGAYPIGSIYMSINDISPAAVFGGTWEQVTDRFLIGAGNNYSLGSTGGDTTHKHNLSNNGWAYLSAHGTGYLGFLYSNKSGSWDSNYQLIAKSGTSESATESDAVVLGGSTDNGSNIPPYLAVYIWKRIA